MVKIDKHKKSLWKKRVDELFRIEMIDQDQNNTLTEMIDSPDDENFTMMEIFLKDCMQRKLSEGLNVGQSDAFHKIVDFLEAPKHDALVLKGFAGVGKSFLIKRLIEYIAQTDHEKSIAIGAPTNKAVRVLYMDSPSNIDSLNAYVLEDIFDAKSRLVYSTIHKLLGMKEEITATGEQLFKADNYNNSNLNQYNVLIVDEVSMLDDNLCNEIMKFSDKIRIIFTGDPKQVPPINSLDCIPFSKTSQYNFNRVELTEIMRQKNDNPIIKLSFEIRNNIDKQYPVPVLQTELNTEDHGVIFLNSLTDKPLVKPLLEKYFKTEEFIKDSNYMKVIAWRNKTVSYINNTVREILYGINPDTYVVGEKLIVRKPIFDKVIQSTKRKTYVNWRVLFTTSEELEVLNVTIVNKSMIEDKYRSDLIFYKLEVGCDNPMKDGYSTHFIYVIHEDSFKDYNQLLELAKKNAMYTRIPTNWIYYFNIQKWSANVTYNYAITAHLSQGSSYNNVLVIEDDLDMNRNVVERNRIKYTAFTRSKEKLYILRKNQE